MPAKAKPNGNAQTSNGSPAAAPTSHPSHPIAADRDGIQVPPERRCAYRTEEGSPCRAARRKESRFCIFHDREFQKHQADARMAVHFFRLREGPDSAEGIQEILRRNIEAVASGKISPRVANSISYAAQIMMTNLPSLAKARSSYSIQEDVSHRMARTVVSVELDRIEAEIREAGPHAYPLAVAEDACRQARSAHRTAAGAAEPACVSRGDGDAFQPASQPQVSLVAEPPWAAALVETVAGSKPKDPGSK